MRFRRAICAWLLAAALIPSSGVAELKGKAGSNPAAAGEPFIKRVLQLMNDERERAGLPPLRITEKLCDSARWHALDMAEGNYFDHTDRQGRTVGRRIASFGYSYRYCGQNIAAGQRTPEEAFQAWMRSPSHRENILRKEFAEVGIATVESPNGKFSRYWVQDFGTP